MRAIFLNTWHGTLRDELRAYVMRTLHTTDVYCFQEALTEDRLPYEDLLADEFAVYVVERRDDAHGTWYANAIYVRKTITILGTGSMFVDDISGIGLASYVTFETTDGPVTICNVHGAPYPGDKLDSEVRLRQSKQIIDAFKNDKRVIIGGDFNLLPQTQSIKIFDENGYQNLISTYNIQSTRNRITYERYPDTIQYYADYAFVSPLLAVESFIVPADVVSDHQPLELEVATTQVAQTSGTVEVWNQSSHHDLVATTSN